MPESVGSEDHLEIANDVSFIVAVEDDLLRQKLIHGLQRIGKRFEVISPDLLSQYDYLGVYVVFLETAGDMERTKSIASFICKKWGRKSRYEHWLDNFAFHYFLA